MKTRIQVLVEALDMIPHPEGGFYKETYRSGENVNGDQAMMTSIYFLLTSESSSNFHRIQSDEHWYFHEGSPLTVHLLTENGHEQLQLGLNIENGERPYHLVKKQVIFGSEVIEPNSYALVSCAVSPGFLFRDFELFKRDDLLKQFPNNVEIVTRLTQE